MTTPTQERNLIDSTTAQHVLWAFGCSGGTHGGSFIEALIRAIQRADPHNADRLAIVYPGYVSAIRIMQSSETGVSTLQSIAATAVRR